MPKCPHCNFTAAPYDLDRHMNILHGESYFKQGPLPEQRMVEPTPYIATESKEVNLSKLNNLSNAYIDVELPKVPGPKALSILDEVFKASGQANAGFAAVLPVLQHLQFQKERVYGQSWQARGEMFSIFPNMCRKWDRIENIMTALAEGKNLSEVISDESKVDTIGDLVVYGILWLTWIAEHQPEAYRKWVENVAKLGGADQD